MYWHVGSRELAFAPMESWNEARLCGKTQNLQVFLNINMNIVKEVSISTLLLHLQRWAACALWSHLCESLLPLQTVLSGKKNSCAWGDTMRNIKNKMIPGHWISKWWTRHYNVNPHNKHSVISAIHHSCSGSRVCYKTLEYNPSTILIQLRKSKVDA